MNRSKTLLVSNILATLYSVYLLCIFGGAIIEAGGADFIDTIGAYFELAFNILGMNSTAVTVLYVILVLLCVHIVTFIIGCLIGWIAYASKKSGTAKLAAILYLIGTICFPVYLFFGLPITIVGFVGSGKQKKINNTTTTI
ncbi:MAG: hypothetical protein E7480_07725 [Ruminococcaceae bacterium]|nr:hypothetical protein [Oscillospiraceae bacterium]